MHEYTTKEKARIVAGAVTAVVIVGLLSVIALGFLWVPPPA
jgi:hypothetical protein